MSDRAWDLSPDLSDSEQQCLVYICAPETGAEQENHLESFKNAGLGALDLLLPRRGGLGGTERSQVDGVLRAFPTLGSSSPA